MGSLLSNVHKKRLVQQSIVFYVEFLDYSCNSPLKFERLTLIVCSWSTQVIVAERLKIISNTHDIYYTNNSMRVLIKVIFPNCLFIEYQMTDIFLSSGLRFIG